MPPQPLPKRLIGGWQRWVVRLPLWLYRLRLGWLLGERFIRLTHRGRRTGRRREVILEVVRVDRVSGQCFAASGWGEQSDWYQNVLHNPQVVIDLAGQRYGATATRLTPAAAAQELGDYARRHPIAFRELTRLILGRPLPGHPAELRQMAEVVPIICFSIRRQP